jgi:hypothetical protein
LGALVRTVKIYVAVLTKNSVISPHSITYLPTRKIHVKPFYSKYGLSLKLMRASSCYQRIASTAPTGLILFQGAQRYQAIDVPICGVLRAFLDLGIFGCCELTLKAVQKPIQNIKLPFIKMYRCMRLPEVDLSRFDAAPLIALTATKEIDYGTETDG